MAFSLTGVTDYVKANEDKLIGKMVLSGKTVSMLTPQVGVKGSAYLNLLDAPATLKAASCGWNPSGTTTISRRKLETGAIDVQETLCHKDLLNTAQSYGVQIAAGAAKLPFEEMIANKKVESISAKVEKLVWLGNTAATAAASGLTLAETKLTNGLIKIIDAESSVLKISGTTNPTSSATNAKTVVDAVVAQMPAEVVS